MLQPRTSFLFMKYILASDAVFRGLGILYVALNGIRNAGPLACESKGFITASKPLPSFSLSCSSLVRAFFSCRSVK